jgi:hypothetical protein
MYHRCCSYLVIVSLLLVAAQATESRLHRQRRSVLTILDDEPANSDAEAILDALWEFEGLDRRLKDDDKSSKKDMMKGSKKGGKGMMGSTMGGKGMMGHDLSFRYL